MNINRGDIWYIGNGYPAVGSEQRAASGPPRRGGLKPAEQPVRRGRGGDIPYDCAEARSADPRHHSQLGPRQHSALQADFYGIGGAARQLLRPRVGQRADRD